jgi:hypothetical protein
MEIIEIVPGVTYPTAVELPCKNVQWMNGRNKSSPGGNSHPKKKNRMIIPGKMNAELQKAAQRQTAANRKILILVGGKRRWVRMADWEHDQAG